MAAADNTQAYAVRRGGWESEHVEDLNNGRILYGESVHFGFFCGSTLGLVAG